MVDSNAETESRIKALELQKEQFEFKETVDKWKNRRRMAWISLWAGLAFPLFLLVADSELIKAVAGEFYLFVGGVVMIYIGAATWRDVKKGE